jgi:hypothetical protein
MQALFMPQRLLFVSLRRERLGTIGHGAGGRESALLSGENEYRKAIFLPANSTLPIRRPGESRGPVTFAIFKSLTSRLSPG